MIIGPTSLTPQAIKRKQSLSDSEGEAKAPQPRKLTTKKTGKLQITAPAKMQSALGNNAGISRNVLQALQGEIVHVQCGSSIWKLPKDVLIQESKYFRDLLLVYRTGETIKLPNGFDPPTFSLFVEYLFTGSYASQVGYVQWSTSTLEPSLVTKQGDGSVSWHEKASIWAYNLGVQLEAPSFMNYNMGIMHRLWMVDRRPGKYSRLNVLAANHACRDRSDSSYALHEFIHNLVFLNWVVANVIDHNDPLWMDFLAQHPNLRNRILMNTTYDANRLWAEQNSLQKLDQYLVPEMK